MSARMELEDLPPRYRAQAEAQIAARSRGKCTSPQAMSAAARAAGKLEKAFESRGEYEYYMGVIVPGIQSGKILKATPHVAFPLLPAKEYGNVKLPAARYTADYVLKYADGTVEVVEIKSKFTRRQQRDYIYRRRLFIDLIAEPKGWKFTEVITPDTKSEINEWKKLARRMKRE